jgi:hypothetical protein
MPNVHAQLPNRLTPNTTEILPISLQTYSHTTTEKVGLYDAGF